MSAAGQPRTVLVMASTFPRFAGDTTPPFVLRLCQAMRAEGWQSLALAPHAAGLATREVLEGVRVHRFRYAPAALERLAYGGGMLANVRAWPWLWAVLPVYLLALLLAAGRLVLRERITVVHAHWIVPQGLVAVLLKKLLFWRSLRVVLTAHGGDLHADMGRIGRTLLRWTMREADALAVVSEDMRALAIGLGMPPDRVMVASMGVDTTTFCPPPPGPARAGILFVGRLAEKKGVTWLLKAIARLGARPGVELTVVGDGPLRGELVAEAEALGIAGRVRFLGALPPAALPPYFQRARVFAMPSVVAASGDQEGLGLVAAEAMACDCPVVAHDLPAVRDLVRHGETGLMVPPADVDALAAALAAVLDDPDLARRLVDGGRRHVQGCYAWTAVAGRYRRLYEGA